MPPADVMQALVAGLIVGAVVAFGSTSIVLAALWHNPRWLARTPNLRVPLPFVGVVLVNGFLLGWTTLGLVLGAALHAIEGARPAGGLGSPNGAFTAGVVAATAALVAALTVVRGRPGWPLTSMALLALLSFGWLLPWLGVSPR
jgi:hypothetical protein